MGNNYPDVTPGQSVQHSARRENAISHLLKDANKFLAGRAKAHSPQSVRVPAYNASGATIQPGEAVQIDVTGNMSGPAFPVVAFDEEETDAPFGVFDRAVAENGMADLIVSGPATVQISGSSGSYAVPTDGGGFERGDEGFLILHISGETEGVVLLGNYYGKIGKVYVGGLGITVTPGEEDDDPDTISANLAPGTDISITPVEVEGATTGQLQISYTGSGGGGTAEYSGPFTVEMTAASVCKVYNPNNSLLAGTVRIGSLSIPVSPKTGITVSWNSSIYITVTYNTTTRDYTIDCTSVLPTNPDSQPQFWYRELATVDGNGVVHQSYWGGNIEIEGRWCN